MCATCGAKSYGQDQPEQVKKDKEKLKRVRDAREVKAARRENAHLN